jgi:hypothetical protein
LPIDRILNLASNRKNTTNVAIENMTQLNTSMVYPNGFVGFLLKWGSSRRLRMESSDMTAMVPVVVGALRDPSPNGDMPVPRLG